MGSLTVKNSMGSKSVFFTTGAPSLSVALEAKPALALFKTPTVNSHKLLYKDGRVSILQRGGFYP